MSYEKSDSYEKNRSAMNVVEKLLLVMVDAGMGVRQAYHVFYLGESVCRVLMEAAKQKAQVTEVRSIVDNFRREMDAPKFRTEMDNAMRTVTQATAYAEDFMKSAAVRKGGAK